MEQAEKRNLALDYFAYLALRIVICVIQALPLGVCERFAHFLAYLCSSVIHIRRSLVDENLRLAFHDLSAEDRARMAQRMWEHLFVLVVEIAHAPRKIHDSNWRDYITPTGEQMLIRAVLADRPAVIVSGHYGNFELCGYLLGVFGVQTHTIVRPLDNVFIDRFINRFRGAKGQHMLPKKGSAQQIDAILESHGTLTILGDQHAGPKGCWVDFFGRPASTPKAIALFSLTNDAPLVVSYSRRVGGPLRHIVGVEATADPRTMSPELAGVPALTQWYTGVLERIIRRRPEQYWWLHRRWREQPQRKRLAA